MKRYQKNPLPVLKQHCHFKIHHLPEYMQKLGLPVIHKLFQQKMIKTQYHTSLRHITLLNWGQHKDKKIRKLLWQCYFPDTNPHVFHILVYRLHKNPEYLATQCKLSMTQIENDLAKAQILQTHLRAIGPYAMELRNALTSYKRKHGPDPIGRELGKALTDKSTIKPWWQINSN